MNPRFSVVIPCRNEAGNIGALVDGIDAACTPIGPFEVIVVDDASTDGMDRIVLDMAATRPWLRLLRHPQSGGQSAAVHNGVIAARAPVIATLDGDGQNPPGELPALLAPLLGQTGAVPADLGLVAGQRVGRQDSASKKMASRLANGLRARILRDATRDTGCGLKAFRRDAYLALPFFNHQHRYLPALFARDGWQVAHVDVRHNARSAGVSNYSNWQRGLVGVSDLAGVAWLLRRRKTVRATEVDAGTDRRMNDLLTLFHVTTRAELLWVLFGFFAQAMFMMRFLIQWIASEKARRSVVPVTFWYFSLLGGVTLLAYAIHRRDPVFIFGQALGTVIYLRNLWLIRAARPD